MSCIWVHILSKILDFERKSLQQDIHLLLILIFLLFFFIFFLLLLLFRLCFLLRSCRPTWPLFSCITLALGTICCNILQERCWLVAGSVTLRTIMHYYNNLILPRMWKSGISTLELSFFHLLAREHRFIQAVLRILRLQRLGRWLCAFPSRWPVFLEVKHLIAKISRYVKIMFRLTASIPETSHAPPFPCILKPNRVSYKDLELQTIHGLGAKQKSYIYSDLYNFSHYSIIFTVPFHISPLVLQPSVRMVVYLWPTVQTTFHLTSLPYLQ